MLPILKRLKQAPVAGIIIKHREPDEAPAQDDQDDPSAAMESCAQDIISAIERKDSKGLAEAIYSAIEIAQSSPEDESDSNSYDAQNQLAGEENE